MTRDGGGAADPAAGRIRVLARLLSIAALAAIVLAFTVELWIGAAVLLIWILFSDALRIGALAPFFGVGRVRDVLLGPMVSGPTDASSSPSPLDSLVGRRGRTVTALDPEGLVHVDGARHTARSDQGRVRSGREVEVVATRLDQLIVEPR